MKPSLIALAALLATPASAGDHNWMGGYVGGVGSYTWTSVAYPDAPAYPVGPPLPDLSGGLLGATVGYNLQINSLVLGVEGDYSFGNVTATERDGNYLTETYKLDALGTVRGRLGYAVGNFLPFITAGVAFERLEIGMQCPDKAAVPFGMCSTLGPFDLRGDKWNTGYVVGGGLEWAASHDVSLKIEGLYSDYGHEDYDVKGVPVTIDRDETLVRFGANFHF